MISLRALAIFGNLWWIEIFGDSALNYCGLSAQVPGIYIGSPLTY